jgi:hypothetical protein
MLNEKSGYTAQLDPKDALELREDLRIGDGLSGLVVLYHRRFLVYFLGDILLRELQFHACGLYRLHAR